MPQSLAACAGAIGGFAGPYVVGALVDTKGGYVTCMQVLGGLFLVQAAMIICEPHHPSLAKELLQTASQGSSGSLHAITGIVQRCGRQELQAHPETDALPGGACLIMGGKHISPYVIFSQIRM